MNNHNFNSGAIIGFSLGTIICSICWAIYISKCCEYLVNKPVEFNSEGRTTIIIGYNKNNHYVNGNGKRSYSYTGKEDDAYIWVMDAASYIEARKYILQYLKDNRFLREVEVDQ